MGDLKDTKIELDDLEVTIDGLPLLVPMAQLSELIGVPVGTLRQWRLRNYGPKGFRVGGAVKYRRDEVFRWLSEQEATG